MEKKKNAVMFFSSISKINYDEIDEHGNTLTFNSRRCVQKIISFI